ncbi:MAG: multiheme c-type cytochrome [Pseudomonadota bacterium]
MTTRSALGVWMLVGAGLAMPVGTRAASKASVCETCHQKKNPGLHKQWQDSKHARNGVSCLDCHQAKAGEPDAFKHNGSLIATLVTPKDCGQCHEAEAKQVGESYHATAGEILHSADAYLAHAAGGTPAATAGCENCHGTVVKIDAKRPNKLARESWPNAGIGRINPDGSKGSCTACHARHSFSVAQARRPEACGKCHLGPDHPQAEIYEESKHGNAFFTHVDEMNLKSPSWVVGKDYAVAPTCATCHMSATAKQPLTHDVGQRISWTLRPPISSHKDSWQKKREAMQDVCAACHAKDFVDGHYAQYDDLVVLYNEKFAKPATAIMDLIKKKGLLERKASFGNDIEWIYWEIWHHEGRRARHGAAMMGPDYTWWHGMYEVAKHFYFEFLPAAQAYKDPEVDAMIAKLLKDDPMHAWINRPSDEIKKDIRSGKMREVYEKALGKAR